MCINSLTFLIYRFFARIQLNGSLRKGREWSIEKADTENAMFDAKMYFRIENCIFGADLSQIRGRRRAHAGAPARVHACVRVVKATVLVSLRLCIEFFFAVL